jgi:L-seryl-tRNA(Ser) seleniumtransferase
VGGGSFPEQNLPTALVAVTPLGQDVESLRQGLLDADIPVIGRVEEGAFCLDMRTLTAEEYALVTRAMQAVLSTGSGQ